MISRPHPLVMGILNVTPDSFSDGGRFNRLDEALRRAESMVECGVDIIDIGGESTRPGAIVVPAAEEIDRVVPVIEAIQARFDVAISVDTLKTPVMKAVLAQGVDLINDICALTDEGATAAVANSTAAVCLMHMQGTPRTMQQDPHYDDVVSDVNRYLADRVEACVSAGIDKERLLIDPGFGFGKTLQHNYQLLATLARFKEQGLPVLVGMSRKSMIGNLLARPTEQRLAGSLACALLAAERGADIIRVHDYQETIDALRVWSAMRQEM